MHFSGTGTICGSTGVVSSSFRFASAQTSSKSGGDGLAVAKRICLEALPKIDELVAPYAAVLSIDRARLPGADEIASWDSATFVGKLVHDESSPLYSPDFRQFVHVSYSVAAALGAVFTDAVKANREKVSEFVTRNIFERHLRLLA